MTAEKIIADLTSRNIFVQQVSQSSPSHWSVVLTCPGDWYYRRGHGSTLVEALDKARTEALKPPPVYVPPKQPKGRVRLTTGRKRVRLKGKVKKRVRL